MSRYILLPELLVDPAAHEIVIGWDPPMRTFFAHVYDRRVVEAQRAQASEICDSMLSGQPLSETFDLNLLDKEPVLAWLGGRFDEFTDVDRFIAALEPYAKIDLLRAQLRTDQIITPDWRVLGNLPPLAQAQGYHGRPS